MNGKQHDIEMAFNTAIEHHREGRLTEAAEYYRKVLALDAHVAAALLNLSAIVLQSGNFEEGAELSRRAAALQPENPGIQNNLGTALQHLGRYDEAISHFRNGLSLSPDDPKLHNNLGNAHIAKGEPQNALISLEKALALDPNYAEAHYNMANALKDLGRMEEAAAGYRQAVALAPNFPQGHFNLAKAYADLGLFEEALSANRRALDLAPDFKEAHSDLIFFQDMIPDIDQAAQQAERRRWDETFIQPLKNKILPHGNDRDPERRLRVGYVSADFRRHSACQGFAPLILEHDRQQFDVICYDASPVNDKISEILRTASTDWRFIRQMNDDQLAETIRNDGIDILIDLSGHTRDNRLTVFGHKPAPLQVTGIGHLAPGVSTIDYRLTTKTITPPEEEHLYPEKPLYLETYFGFTPPASSPQVGPSPVLESGKMTFGFLGRHTKITDQVLNMWARILGDVRGSRLLLKYKRLDDDAYRQSIIDYFSAQGLEADRLTLLGKTDQAAHLAAHNRVDILLDTLPHGGGITALESLWMGVPVIGMANTGKAGGRIIESINQPLGLEAWIAESPEDYHAIAVHWAARPDELAALRQKLRQRVSETYARFPHDVETVYRDIWRKWCE